MQKNFLAVFKRGGPKSALLRFLSTHLIKKFGAIPQIVAPIIHIYRSVRVLHIVMHPQILF